jgi:hypothetical protein
VDKPTILPVILRIGQQIRFSLTFAKSSADLRVFIFQGCSASELMDTNSNSKTKMVTVMITLIAERIHT